MDETTSSGAASKPVSGIAEDARSKAEDLAREARERGASVASDMKDKVYSSVERQQKSVADQLSDTAHAMHRSGKELEGHQDWLAHLVERGAAELNSVANTLRSTDMRSLYGRMEDFARRQPMLFMGAAVLTGFAVVRVGRSAAASTSKDDLPDIPEFDT